MLVNTLFFLFSQRRTAFFVLTWSSLGLRTQGCGGWGDGCAGGEDGTHFIANKEMTSLPQSLVLVERLKCQTLRSFWTGSL